MRPIFVGNELVLVRDDDGGVIGAWLDWPGIQTWLIGEVRDLLPKARLEPAPGAVRTERLLASLPARLGERRAKVPFRLRIEFSRVGGGLAVTNELDGERVHGIRA